MFEIFTGGAVIPLSIVLSTDRLRLVPERVGVRVRCARQVQVNEGRMVLAGTQEIGCQRIVWDSLQLDANPDGSPGAERAP